MKAIRNKVQLIGNVGATPILKQLDSGKSVINFSMATNEKFKNQEGTLITDTQWHYVVAWGKTAEIISQYVSKGQEIAIEGKLTHRSYEANGEKRYLTEVLCNEVLLLQSKSNDSAKEDVFGEE